MKWDKKLAALAVMVIALVIAGTAVLIYYTNQRIDTAAERIAGAAEEGFEKMTARIDEYLEKSPWKLSGIMVAKAGRFEGQQKYRGFDRAWLKELDYVPGEYLDEDVKYTYSVTFRLTNMNQDEEGVHISTIDTVWMRKDGDLYYVWYDEESTGKSYYFIVTCPPLTEWLEEFKD